MGTEKENIRHISEQKIKLYDTFWDQTKELPQNYRDSKYFAAKAIMLNLRQETSFFILSMFLGVSSYNQYTANIFLRLKQL